MLAAGIKKCFPKGVAIPDDFEAFCKFADANSGVVSGLFEFDPQGTESARAWFDNDEEAASQFAAFGRGPDGSLYAFWLHAGKDTSQAPIVLLDSECQESKVIAGNFREFMRLLSFGYDEPGRYPTLDPENPKSAVKLRQWLKKEFKVAPPATAAELVQEAQRRHPDLVTWIRSRQQQHFGSK
jgi:hypothetical protein